MASSARQPPARRLRLRRSRLWVVRPRSRSRARGLRERLVTEIDPLKALEAVMDGFRVMPMEEAVPIGDIFCTLTGNIHVVREEHFRGMKDGAVVCNSGHFNVELDLEALARISERPARAVREFVQEFVVEGKRVFVLGEGRLINLAAAEGHPASVMDMSFANQSLGAEYLVNNASTLTKTCTAFGGGRSRDRATQARGDASHGGTS